MGERRGLLYRQSEELSRLRVFHTGSWGLGPGPG
jgi:hypothetical protein